MKAMLEVGASVSTFDKSSVAMFQINSQNQRRLTMSWLATGMFVVLTVGIILYTLAVQTLASRNVVVKTLSVITSITNFRATVKDLETEQRGFVITGDPIYLETYTQQRNSIPARLQTLKESTASEPAIAPLIDSLASRVSTRVKDLDDAITARRKSGFSAASKIVHSNRGLKVMKDLRKTIGEMLVIENKALEEADDQVNSKTRELFLIFVALGVSSLALFFGFAYFMRRSFCDVNEAHNKVLMQNRSLTEFYSMLSHELRSPMTSIRGALRLIKGRANEITPELSKQLLNIAADETERMLRLINELLDLEKIESGNAELHLTVAEPARIVSRTLQGMKAMAAEANIHLVEEVNANLPVKCDVDRITQVLTNLVSNAIKFSAPDDQVTVSIDFDPAEQIKFSVKDVGPGIPQNQRHKVFQKFQQLESSKSSYKGTGLGLAISKSIAEIHGGKIGFESEEGKGTTFWFALPASSEAISSN